MWLEREGEARADVATTTPRNQWGVPEGGEVEMEIMRLSRGVFGEERKPFWLWVLERGRSLGWSILCVEACQASTMWQSAEGVH